MLSTISIRHMIPLMLLSAGLMLAVIFASVAVPKLERDADRVAADLAEAVIRDMGLRVSYALAAEDLTSKQLEEALLPATSIVKWTALIALDEEKPEAVDDRIILAQAGSDFDPSLVNMTLTPKNGELTVVRHDKRLAGRDMETVTDVGYLNVEDAITKQQAILVVGANFEEIRSRVRGVASFPSQMIAIMVMLTAMAVVLILNRRLRNRSMPIIEALKAMDRGEIAVTIDLDGEDEFAEIGRLLERFNSNRALSDAEIQNQRALTEREVAYKTSYLRNLSRSLRNPLTSSLGHLDLVLETDIPHGAATEVAGAISALQKITHFSNDLLEVAIGNSSPYRRSQSPFCINLLLQETIDLYGRIVRESGNDLTVSATEETPVWVYVDSTSLRLLLNLALQTIFRGADQHAFSLELIVDEDQLNGMYSCSFVITRCRKKNPDGDSANERGTARQIQDEKLFRGILDRSDRSNKILDILARNVEATLDETKDEDGGYIARITFDARKASPVETFNLLMLNKTLGRSLSILLVESDLRVGAVLATGLERWGHSVHLTTNGQAAVDSVRDRLIGGQNPFDLLIIDNECADLSGEEILRGFAAFDDRQEKNAKLLTTVDPTLDYGQMVDTGFNDILLKPFRLRDLREKISQIG